MNNEKTVLKEGSLYERKASTEVFKIDGKVIAHTFEYRKGNSTLYNFSWDLKALQEIFNVAFKVGEYSKDWSAGFALLNNKKALHPITKMEVVASLNKAQASFRVY